MSAHAAKRFDADGLPSAVISASANGWVHAGVATPFLIGTATLALGAAYYWGVRGWFGDVGLAAMGEYPIAAIPLVLGSLPTFLHVLAFSLLTSALGRRRRSLYARNCAAWVGVNTAFEIGQHALVAKALANQLDRWCHDTIVCEHTGRYLVQGTFDVADIVAGVLGGGLAYGLLQYTQRHVGSASC